MTRLLIWMPFIHIRSTGKYLPEHLVAEGTALTAERVTLVMFTCSTFVNGEQFTQCPGIPIIGPPSISMVFYLIYR